MKKIIEKLRSGKAVKFAFLGDSVTAGYFESSTAMHDGRDLEAVYHKKLKELMEILYPGADIDIINAGIGGDIAAEGLCRMDSDVIAHKPELCVVCYGLNDVNRCAEAKEYTEALSAIFAKLREADIPAIFMTPNMLNTYVSESASEAFKEYAAITAEYQTKGKMDSFMEAARKCAWDNGVPVCDCYAKWKELYNSGTDVTNLLANKINHPNRDMHLLFARELVHLITKEDMNV